MFFEPVINNYIKTLNSCIIINIISVYVSSSVHLGKRDLATLS